MATAFSRTMRSLNADDFRGPRVLWIVSVLLLAAWTWWFFTAEIPDPADAARRLSPAKLATRGMGRAAQPAVRKDARPE